MCLSCRLRQNNNASTAFRGNVRLCLHLDVNLRMMSTAVLYLSFFFFQAEDGIRDYKVTGVQTCALPICRLALEVDSWDFWSAVLCAPFHGCSHACRSPNLLALTIQRAVACYCKRSLRAEIGRASCRERV